MFSYLVVFINIMHLSRGSVYLYGILSRRSRYDSFWCANGQIYLWNGSWCLLDKGPAIIEFVNNTANTKEGTNGQT